MLKGGETGRVIVWNHPGWMQAWKGDMVLVDGKQRLNAVIRFLHNEIPAFGAYLKDYEDAQKLLYGQDMIFQIASVKTRADVLDFYISFNAGGTPHDDAEINRVRKLLEKEKGS